MTWVDTTVGELVDVKHGFAFKSEYFTDSGEYVVLSPGNCYNEGGFKSKGEKEKWYCGDVPKDYLLNEGDLLVVMTDLVNTAPVLGGSFLIPENNKYLHNQRLGLVQIIEPSKTNKRFLYYLFNTHGYRGQVRGSASGATVRHTAPERIKSCKVRIPEEYEDQKRIADFLGAYDDLIENNKRRIELLEESAGQLYKEWFVRFRFPGHEHVKLTNGVPEGWQRCKVGDLLTLQRGFDLPIKNRVEGTVPIYASTGINGYHNEYKVKAPGIVTGRSGSLGTVTYVSKDFWPLNTALWVKEFKKVTPPYVFFFLRSLKLANYNGGAAVPTLNRNDVHRIHTFEPPEKLLEAFTDHVNPIFNQIDTLAEQNIKLVNARNTLLPKVMNGEIAV